MCIQLRRIYEFEEDIVNFINNHSDAYNLEGILTTGADVPDGSYLYNICNGEQTVGFFELVPVNKYEYGDGYEIEIGIFDAYQYNEAIQDGARYATQCLENFQNSIDNWETIVQDKHYIYASIKAANPRREQIRMLLIRAGFIDFDAFIPSEFRHNDRELDILLGRKI